LRNPLLVSAMVVTGAIALAGLIEPQATAAVAQRIVRAQFIGADDERPEFATTSWLTMLFAAGMGVGLLFYGAAEPMTHFDLFRGFMDPSAAATDAQLATYFHWGLHAWAIYAMVGLVIAYFTFRRGGTMVLSTPITGVLGTSGWPRHLGFAVDLCAIVPIAVGLAGSLAMGVFQVQAGLARLLDVADPTMLTAPVYAALCVAFVLPLMVELDRGMALMSNTAMIIAGALLVFLVLVGPTHYVMNTLVEGLGNYTFRAIPHGFSVFSFHEREVGDWFRTWTLSYMIWWLAWSPFVGVFTARISRGRTIREFLLFVIGAPTIFSVLWFGTFGALGFSEILAGNERLLGVTRGAFDSVTFVILEAMPLTTLTTMAVVVACFLFPVTSVVSAAYVLAMFAERGVLDPGVRVKLGWGVILAALGLVMILSGDPGAVRSMIAAGAIVFVFIVPLLMLCLLKALLREPRR